MRKFTVYRWVITALAVGTMANTAYAANVGSWSIPGGRAIVIGGSSTEDLKDVLGQLQGALGGGCSGKLFFGNLPSCGSGSSCTGIGQPGSWCPGTGNMGGSGGTNRPEEPDKPVTPDVPVTPEEPDLGGSQDAYGDQVVSLVNAERAKAGLPALKVHTKAEGAALLRAKEIEKSFSHTRPNGSSFSTALTMAGISFQSAGENIAYGQQTPEMVMRDWMNSSGHRANILNRNFTSIAVGHYQNSAGVDYWVQLFIQ